MADNKKYYYMRLKENFFDSNELTILESMQDGYLYSNILLKLYLRSLKDNGKLMFNDRIPYNAQMIATITRHQVGTVEKALRIFQEMGLIEILDNGAIYMLDIQQFIGKSSTEADRIRTYRMEIESQKAIGVQMYEKRTPKIEIDKDIYVFKTKDKDYVVKESDLQRYKDVYPFVDVEQELKKMGLWLDSNVSKRKTHKGMPRFINNWLNNCKPKEIPSYIDEIPEI